MSKIADRLTSRMSIEPSGCWFWNGAKDKKGYGHIRVNGKQEQAHRASYRAFIGPIPDGLTIDHLCENKSCINPKHLDVVTIDVNVQRAKERRTHCPNGHSYTERSVYWRNGRRQCRPCNAAAQRRRKDRLKEKSDGARP